MVTSSQTFDSEKAFQRLIRECVAPLMKAHGFEQQVGLGSFRRFLGKTIQFLSFQAWRGQDTTGYDFTINLSFVEQTPEYSNKAGRLAWYIDEKILMTARAGSFTHGRENWYRLRAENASALAMELLSDLSTKIIPVLDFLSSVDVVLELEKTCPMMRDKENFVKNLISSK